MTHQTSDSSYNRILHIDKPAGMTSFGVVARVRRVLSQQAGKKVKVGHCGTLDPFATGLLLLVTGTECRNAMRYTKLDKTYEATIILGQTSTTGDPEGEITPYVPEDAKVPIAPPSRQQLDKVLQHFIGQIRQRPPIFSAIKINGQRAYKLARDGKEVELPERTITTHSLEVLEYQYPRLVIRTRVSSGTYIRSLAVDIGTQLGTGAYCAALRRTAIADWLVAEAQRLQDFGIVD